MEAVSPLTLLLQRLDAVVVPQDPTICVASPTSHSSVPEVPAKVVEQLTAEIRSIFCERILQQFPCLAAPPHSIADACGHEAMVGAARNWMSAELCDGVFSTAASPMEPTATSPFPLTAVNVAKASRLRRRTLPREMSPSMIVREFSSNTIDMILMMLQHAGRALASTTSAQESLMYADDASASLMSTAAQSPLYSTRSDGTRRVDNEDEVIFLDDFDAVMDKLENEVVESSPAAPSPACRHPERVASYCTPSGPSVSVSASATASSPSAHFPDAPQSTKRTDQRPSKKSTSAKRRRDESTDSTLDDLTTDVKRLLKRQDQLLAGLATMLFANVELSSTVALHSVMLCLSDPLLRWLAATLEGLTATPGGPYQRLHDTVVEAAEEMMGCHDVDILPRLSTHVGMSRYRSSAGDDVSRQSSTGAPHSRSASPLQHLVPVEDSQSASNTMKGSISGYTADGDKFSIPPPLQRTVSDVVRRGAPHPLDKSRLSPVGANQSGQVSPPRSPLFGMRPSGTFGISPHSGSLPAPRTAGRRLTGPGSRTPCTVPKRSAEIPSYMLMKRKSSAMPKPLISNGSGAAIDRPPVVALTGSPDCSISLVPPAPPMLSLDCGSSKRIDDSFLHHGREDRVLFMDDDDED
jgi:hypothetical protein